MSLYLCGRWYLSARVLLVPHHSTTLWYIIHGGKPVHLPSRILATWPEYQYIIYQGSLRNITVCHLYRVLAMRQSTCMCWLGGLHWLPSRPPSPTWPSASICPRGSSRCKSRTPSTAAPGGITPNTAVRGGITHSTAGLGGITLSTAAPGGITVWWSVMEPLQCHGAYHTPLQCDGASTVWWSLYSVMEPLQCDGSSTVWWILYSVIEPLQCDGASTVWWILYSVMEPLQCDGASFYYYYY